MRHLSTVMAFCETHGITSQDVLTPDELRSTLFWTGDVRRKIVYINRTAMQYLKVMEFHFTACVIYTEDDDMIATLRRENTAGSSIAHCHILSKAYIEENQRPWWKFWDSSRTYY